MAMVRNTGPDHHFLLRANVWIGARARACAVISGRVCLGGGRGVAAVSTDGASIGASTVSAGRSTIKGAAFRIAAVRERRGRSKTE
jgi:hypothetical protein